MNRTIYNPVIRDTTTFIRTAAETGNKYTEVEVTLMPGGGTPMHFHESYAETFKVIKGALNLQLADKQQLTLSPGESHTVPIGVLHCFSNASPEQVTFIVLIEPGSPGFEKALRILYGLAVDGLTAKNAMPKKIAWLAVIMANSDMNAPGLLSLLAPLFKRYARSRNGIIAWHYLVDRYCRDREVQPNTLTRSRDPKKNNYEKSI